MDETGDPRRPLREARAEVAALALRDLDTGLPTHHLFTELLHHSLVRANRTGEGLSVLFFDLSPREKVGPERLDAIRGRVSRLLQGLVREGDVVAHGSSGGIVVLAEGCMHPQDARMLGSRLSTGVDTGASLPDSVVAMHVTIVVVNGSVLADQVFEVAESVTDWSEGGRRDLTLVELGRPKLIDLSTGQDGPSTMPRDRDRDRDRDSDIDSDGDGDGDSVDVLVVDDDPQILELLRVNLQEEDVSFCLARDGWEALEAATTRSPRVILLDIGLPGLDGRQVLSRLRQDPQHAETPVILCSGWSSDEDQWRAWASGASSVIVKPFDIEVVLGEIRRLTRRRLSPAELEPDGVVVNRRVLVEDLRPGMVLDAGILDAHGQLLLAAGREITEALRERLLRVRHERGVAEPLFVRTEQLADVTR